MQKCSLNEEVWQLFIGNKMSESETAELYKHLQEDCPHCEEFFAGSDRQKTDKLLMWTGHVEVERLMAPHEFDKARKKINPGPMGGG